VKELRVETNTTRKYVPPNTNDTAHQLFDVKPRRTENRWRDYMYFEVTLEAEVSNKGALALYDQWKLTKMVIVIAIGSLGKEVLRSIKRASGPSFCRS
ncbi:hypothetical protein MKW98_013251, partial [Papaver atlanticum]